MPDAVVVTVAGRAPGRRLCPARSPAPAEGASSSGAGTARKDGKSCSQHYGGPESPPGPWTSWIFGPASASGAGSSTSRRSSSSRLLFFSLRPLPCRRPISRRRCRNGRACGPRGARAGPALAAQCRPPACRGLSGRSLRRAGRCTACVLACPEGALSRESRRLVVSADICTGCGPCVTACRNGAFALRRRGSRGTGGQRPGFSSERRRGVGATGSRSHAALKNGTGPGGAVAGPAGAVARDGTAGWLLQPCFGRRRDPRRRL